MARYLKESRRPLASLAFIAPLLLVYEAGVLLLGMSAVRNGADVWLRQLLDLVGFHSYFLLPIAAVAVLLGWHHTTHQPWRLSAGVLYGMLIESAALGLILLVIAQIHANLTVAMTGGGPVVAATAQENISGLTAAVVSYFGAGIYEEMLFRLMLLPAIIGLIALIGAKQRPKIIVAVVVSSLCFAVAHYVGPHGDELHLYTFTFRFLAGGFFALLFVRRGFGIAAGAHACYDVFVGV